MLEYRFIWLFLFVLSMSQFPVQAGTTEEALLKQAEKLVDVALDVDGGGGIQVAVIKQGALVFSYAVGKADLENEHALSTKTRMRIGSVSKVFTTMLVARLMQEGKIELDADIREYVPDFPEKEEIITVRQLANHTSGIRHYDFTNRAEANNVQFYENLSDALPIYANDPLLGKPGDEHHYSGFGVNLLGIAIERVSQFSYAKSLAQFALEPLKLNATVIDHPMEIIPNRSRFYTLYGGHLINTIWRDSSDYYPSGGLLSSAEDLAIFTHAVFEGGYLDRQRQALIRMESTTSSGAPVGYSFGWQIGYLESGKPYYFHGGETNGGYANVLYVPSSALIVSGITNYNVYPDQENVAFFDLVRKQIPDLF